MRKVIASEMITLDGFFAGPEGDLSWHLVDDEYRRLAVDLLSSANMLVFGRVTYELMVGFWPTEAAATDDPVVAEKMNTLSKIVFSQTLSHVEWGKWKNARLAKEDLRETIMKFLLTSGGIANDSIRKALVDLLGKPIAEARALCILTAAYAVPDGPAFAWQNAREWGEMGWKAFGILEPTALSSTSQECWLPLLEAADVLLVGGGESFYLCYWMHQSGLADILPSLQDKVYVGMSAGSMVVTPTFGEQYA